MKVLERRDVPMSRRPHVVTSQRHDVGSTNTGVNKQKRHDVSTSRRLNVATSQRRDVSTSRRLNVATSQRRDVSTSRRLNVATSARDLPSIIKSTKGSELEASGNVRPRARKSRAAATLITKKSPRFVLFPIFGQ